MSNKSPEVGGKNNKRRKTQERSGASKVDGATPCDSSKRLEQDERKANNPFRRPDEPVERKHRSGANDGDVKTGPLLARMEENTVALRMLIRPGRFCARCEERASGAVSLAARLLEEAGSALRERDIRYQQVMKDLVKERKEKKEWEEMSEEWMERGDMLIDENEALEERTKKAEEKCQELEERTRRMAEDRKEMEWKLEEMVAESEDRGERLKRGNKKIMELELERNRLHSAYEERLVRLADEKKEVELERNQLRAALDRREEESGNGRGGNTFTSPPPDVEMEETETRGGGLPPLRVTLPSRPS